MNLTKTFLFSAAVVFTLYGVLACAATARAEIIAQHLDDSSPSTEGWTLESGASPGGSAVNDSGTLAWAIDDNSTEDPPIWWKKGLTSQEVTDAAASGWKLTGKVRVVDASDPETVFCAYYTGAGYYGMNFNQEVQGAGWDGDVTVTLSGGGGSYTTTDGAHKYHTYELVFDPVAGTADLFVDGIERISNDDGGIWGDAPMAVKFGGTSMEDTGQGNWNKVTFEIVPEPSTLVLLGSGLLGLLLLLLRRRSK